MELAEVSKDEALSSVSREAQSTPGLPLPLLEQNPSGELVCDPRIPGAQVQDHVLGQGSLLAPSGT